MHVCICIVLPGPAIGSFSRCNRIYNLIHNQRAPLQCGYAACAREVTIPRYPSETHRRQAVHETMTEYNAQIFKNVCAY